MSIKIYSIELVVKQLKSMLIEEILRIIHSNDSKETKEHKIRNIVESLYPSRGGLTDFHVWVEEEKERFRINKPISELNDTLWELVITN